MRHRFLTLLAALTLSLSGTAHAAGLNDTGITDCWNDSAVVTTGVEVDNGTHPRQDCRYGRDAAAKSGALHKVGGGGKGFDFSKIGNNGTVLPESAALGSDPTDWACTRDNVTGLVWEVKTNYGPRSIINRFSWYNSNPATNGGSAGTENADVIATEFNNSSCVPNGRCDTEKYVADVNVGAGLCGATDWRMPTKKELISIVDAGRFNPAIDLNYFPDADFFGGNPFGEYFGFWSATADAYGSSGAWWVDFYNGSASRTGKSAVANVRLVRAGQ